MWQKNLPQKWQNRIETYLKETGSEFKVFSAADFQNDLKITLADRSYCFFYYAFYWIDEDAHEIAVFTEHCGYHIFPLMGTKLETINKAGNNIKTEDFTVE